MSLVLALYYVARRLLPGIMGLTRFNAYSLPNSAESYSQHLSGGSSIFDGVYPLRSIITAVSNIPAVIFLKQVPPTPSSIQRSVYSVSEYVEVEAAQLRSRYLCPISSEINTAISNYLPYPIDIYDPERFQSLVPPEIGALVNQTEPSFPVPKSGQDIQTIKGAASLLSSSYLRGTAKADEYMSLAKTDLFYKCTSERFHVCSTLTRCPVSMENFIAATKSMDTYSPKHSICALRDKLRDPGAVVNLVILGGSETQGAGSRGCCCSKETDPKCLPLPFGQSICSPAPGRGEAETCRWGNVFAHWLQGRAMATIKYHNFARGGTTSLLESYKISQQLEDSGIKLLTDSDIVFIEHSVNDMESYANDKVEFTKVKRGLEMLVRNILTKSTHGSWPTVIILEFYPGPNTYNQNSEINYSPSYLEVASHYSLPMWSFKEMYHSNYTKTHLKRLLPYFTHRYEAQWARSQDRDRFLTHPPWHFHLFHADMIAAIFSDETRACMRAPDGLSNRARKPGDTKMTTLPKTLTTLDDAAQHCDPDFKPHLEASSAVLLANKQDAIGSSGVAFESFPSDSWKLFEDRPKKTGWIFEAPENRTGYSSRLAFNLSGTYETVTGNGNAVLIIHYMKTYKNAGMVNVNLCGRHLLTLDALWESHGTHRVSMLEPYSIVYPVYAHCRAPAPLTLEFHAAIQATSPPYNEPRGTEKFKIAYIKICKYR
jgi:hypothetical protein